MIKTFQEFRSDISIIDLALANGYAIDKTKGSKWPVLYNALLNERIIIANAKSCSNQGYWNPENDSDRGTLIDFIKNRLGTLFKTDLSKPVITNINAVLYGWLQMDFTKRESLIAGEIKVNEVQEHRFSADCLKPLSSTEYLRFRGFTLQTINSPVFRDRIFSVEQNGFYNTAFPLYDRDSSSIIGIEVRNKDFKHNTPGSDKSKGVWLSNKPGQLKHIILCESPIDAISYFQLKQPPQSLYVSFGGSISDSQIETVKAIRSMATATNDFSYIIAMDNDEKGNKYDKKLEQLLGSTDQFMIDKPIAKDYNEDLKNAAIMVPSYKRKI